MEQNQKGKGENRKAERDTDRSASHSQYEARDCSGHPLAKTMGWVANAMGHYRFLGDVSTPISSNYPPLPYTPNTLVQLYRLVRAELLGIDRRCLENSTFYLLLLYLQQRVLTHPHSSLLVLCPGTTYRGVRRSSSTSVAKQASRLKLRCLLKFDRSSTFLRLRILCRMLNLRRIMKKNF